MTDQKAKARELANKFIEKSVFDMSRTELQEARTLAKKWVLICVDEILQNIIASEVYIKNNVALDINKEFWLDVKNEITLL